VLRDQTEWVFVPSNEDPGQMRVFPNIALSDYLFRGFRGTHVATSIKKVTLANNPLRVSFLGKEIAICRYDYLKKVK